jgi:ribosomal protein S18 acetylase RimI-like enzyme
VRQQGMQRDNYTIRHLGPGDALELAAVTRMCMETVLETIPEFGGSEATARAHLPNFSFDEMRAMLTTGAASENQRILAVVADGGEVVGYSLFSVKTDDRGVTYGYLFSRRVAPPHRRRGIATRLLGEAHAWFRSRGARYARAETHASNRALQSLLGRHGYLAHGPYEAAWPYVVLEKIM